MSQSEYGLHRLGDAELKRLLRALHRGALPSPVTRSALIEKAFGHIEAHLDLIVGRDLAAAKALVMAVLAERGAEGPATGSRRGASSLVYMGPASPGTRSRDLIDQARELLSSTTSRAHVLGLRLDDDRGLLRTLAAVIAGRDAHVRIAFAAEGHADAHGAVRAFVGERIPKSDDKLELFVCAGARLRARAIVIDGQRVLVTSGELTAREEDGAIDVGVVVHDPALAEALEDEWTKLLALGVVEPLRAE